MTEESGDIHGFCSCLNQFCCMGVTEAVRIEIKAAQQGVDSLVLVWHPVWQNAQERTTGKALWGGNFFRKNNKLPTVRNLIDYLICFAEKHFLLCLSRFKCSEIRQKSGIRIKSTGTRGCFRRIKIACSLALPYDADLARHKVNIIPCETECFADSETCVIEDFIGVVIFFLYGNGDKLLRCNHHVWRDFSRSAAGNGNPRDGIDSDEFGGVDGIL